MRLLAALAVTVCGLTVAQAQTQRPAVPRVSLPIELPRLNAQSANPAEAAFDQLHQGLQKVAKDAADHALADLNAALTDATNRADEISKPCWKAQIDFIGLLPVMWAQPPAEIGLALGIQIKRDLLTAMTGSQTGSIKVACAALFGDEMKIFVNVGALFGLRVLTGGAL